MHNTTNTIPSFLVQGDVPHQREGGKTPDQQMQPDRWDLLISFIKEIYYFFWSLCDMHMWAYSLLPSESYDIHLQLGGQSKAMTVTAN